VSHPKLFTRLHSCGVRGVLLSWLRNFFTGRTHQTKIDSVVSDVAVLLSGVVQGSGIVPTMFFTFINELIGILEEFNITVKLFADDAKMYLKIVHDVDIVQLQAAVTFLVGSAGEWQLGVSIEKCCVLSIGHHVTNPHITIDNCMLPTVLQICDLRVVVCDNLSPSAHINETVAKAHKCSSHACLCHLC